MYAALDQIMSVQMPQMELYSEIGKAVCRRNEKGTAFAATAYLREHYPDAKGFSPRNIRRMRDFYRTYENQPALLSLAMKIGWTQNVVILEADLPMELREWYLKVAMQLAGQKRNRTRKSQTTYMMLLFLITKRKYTVVRNGKGWSICIRLKESTPKETESDTYD